MDIVKNVSKQLHQEESTNEIQRSQHSKGCLYIVLTLIGLAAEALRIKQTDLNTGLSGLT